MGKLTVNVIGQGGRVGPRRGQVGEPERESGKSGLSNPAPLPAAAPVFIVRTPYVNVNDSNGEFAITVNKDGGSYTRVFRGRVLWRTQEFKDNMSEYAITLKENYQVRLGAPEWVRYDARGPIRPHAWNARSRAGGLGGKNEQINCQLICFCCGKES